MNGDAWKLEPGKRVDLKKWPTKPEDKYEKEDINTVRLPQNIEEMAIWQEKLYAQNKYGIIVVLQAMDAAGKDSMIKKVFSRMNPQGIRVTSFKQPSEEELDRDYLWRINRALPRRGEIAIFNRSHYEDVIVTRVHELLRDSSMPPELVDTDIWDTRFRQINDWERYLTENGFVVVKFFLHISKEEQAKRLMDRIRLQEKNWKFSFADINERRHWEAYRDAYEDMLQKTSTSYAPWHIVPADKKWFSRYLVSEVMLACLRKINPTFPPLSQADQKRLDAWKDLLDASVDIDALTETEKTAEK